MQRVYTGIDIGTYHVKVVIAAPGEHADSPLRVIGTGQSVSRGMRHGYIVDGAEATKSIREALQRAMGSAKVQVKSVRLAVGGVSMDEIRTTGDITLTQSGGIITTKDLERVQVDAVKRASTKLANRTVLHHIPIEYRLDGNKIVGKPEGLHGTKLSADFLLITMLTQHYDELCDAVERTGVEVEDVMAAPLAASLVMLTKIQKTAGVCLANIGAETLSMIVFDNDTPVSIKVFPIGSSDITNSIALSFQIPLTEAEAAKRGGVGGTVIPEKKVQALVTAKLKDMFSLINSHLKTIGRQRLLPAGIVITGGGSGLFNASETAKAVLKLPSQVGLSAPLARASSVDATWAVAHGLCRWGYAEEASAPTAVSLGEVFHKASDSIKQTLRSLLP